MEILLDGPEAFNTAEVMLDRLDVVTLVPDLLGESPDVVRDEPPGLRDRAAVEMRATWPRAGAGAHVFLHARRHVWLEIEGGPSVPGVFEAGHSDEEKGNLAAVHFVRFRLTAQAVGRFRSSAVDLVVDHPAARARVRLSEETKAELLTDLVG